MSDHRNIDETDLQHRSILHTTGDCDNWRNSGARPTPKEGSGAQRRVTRRATPSRANENPRQLGSAMIHIPLLFISAFLSITLAVGASASTQTQEKQVKNITLVHGAWADGSGWQRINDILRARGYNVNIVQNPLTSLADDVAAVDRVLARQDGPTLLVGHSYGGVVITEAGDAANVAGLVYISAFVPDVGESVATLTGGGAQPPLQPSVDGFLFFDPTIFPQAFAQDLPATEGAFLAAAQVPPAGVTFGTPVSHAAWKTRRSWYVLTTEDRIIPPDAQRKMATRANAAITEVRGSHASYVSQPEVVADAIDAAARAASQ
jgi:pimeloyl-ACP methyl ester carboxylesterase